MDGVKGSDWKLFRERLPQWQERYMAGVVEKCRQIIETDAKASDRYWKLERLINKEKRNPGVIVHGVRRSMMWKHVVELLAYDAITVDDLEGFIDEFKSSAVRSSELLK